MEDPRYDGLEIPGRIVIKGDLMIFEFDDKSEEHWSYRILKKGRNIYLVPEEFEIRDLEQGTIKLEELRVRNGKNH